MSERPGEHLTALRVSRRRRTCEECHRPIGVGERYARLSLPPTVEWGSGRWWSIAVHESYPCPSEAGDKAEAPR